MKDYVLREDVLRCVEEDGHDNELDLGYPDHNEAFQEIIKDIPAADVVEVRHGHWVHGREVSREYVGDCLVGIFYDRWTCSECGYVVDDREYSGINYKFCPNCGAKMTEV